MARVEYPKSSPYARTPQTSWYLSIYEPRNIYPDGTDKYYKIPAKFANRPDLAANELYQNSSLWWIFSITNPNLLIDPINDFTTDLEIRVPSIDRLRLIL